MSDKSELERRTKAFALRVIRFLASLPKTKVAEVLGFQLLKSGTSIGANYREANRAESRSDFIHKIGVTEKEAAETQYWLEIFEELGIGQPENRCWLLHESGELVTIFTSIGRTSKSRNLKTRSSNSQFAIRKFEIELNQTTRGGIR